MLSYQDIAAILDGYDKNRLTVSTLGSHSALEIARGAKDEGLKNLIVCQKGRDKTYSKHYLVHTRKGFDQTVGCVDEIALIDKFSDLISEDILKHLRIQNALFVPNRSFSVYVPYDSIENRFNIPLFGNRFLLRAEERTEPRNQYELMQKAGIRTPQRFKSASEIDRLCIIKVSEAQRKYERAFFFAASLKEFEQKSSQMLKEGKITQAGLDTAVIEEVILGAQFNFNFFHSPISGETELMGIDTRRQTNLDGILRLPAAQQMDALQHVPVKNIEVGHIASTLRESLLEKVFVAAERLVETCKKEYAPGLIGPFALQGAITSEEGKEDLMLFDLSFRVPGSPGIAATPYTGYTYGQPMSIGRRIAIEIKQAVKLNRLHEVLT